MIKVKEIFSTIQGEGEFCGQPAIFIRLSGCNIWNGLPETKQKSACPYCDTDFINGEKKSVKEILDALKRISNKKPLIVITGGEPLLQDIKPLCYELIRNNYRVQIETNGTIDFEMNGVSISMSPKVRADKIKLKKCDTLKILYPHPNNKITPENFDNPSWGIKYKSLQPIEIENNLDKTKKNINLAIEKIMELDSDWRLGLQIHKIIGLQ